jgi:hypothetical protein
MAEPATCLAAQSAPNKCHGQLVKLTFSQQVQLQNRRVFARSKFLIYEFLSEYAIAK